MKDSNDGRFCFRSFSDSKRISVRLGKFEPGADQPVLTKVGESKYLFSILTHEDLFNGQYAGTPPPAIAIFKVIYVLDTRTMEVVFLVQHRNPCPQGKVRVQWLCHLNDSFATPKAELSPQL